MHGGPEVNEMHGDGDRRHSEDGWDYMHGGEGADKIYGNAGSDVMRGSDGRNRVADFEKSMDLLNVHDLLQANGLGDDDLGQHFGYRPEGVDTVVTFDKDGSGEAVSEDIVTLEGVTISDMNQLISFLQTDDYHSGGM